VSSIITLLKKRKDREKEGQGKGKLDIELIKQIAIFANEDVSGVTCFARTASISDSMNRGAKKPAS
jgi:uncharacterized alkaline shock family protein YloU